MPEGEVLYSNVRFIKANSETSERVFPSAAPTFSEVKNSSTRPPTAKPPEGPQQAELSRRSKLSSERFAVLVLSALLTAAVIALCVTTSRLERTPNNCKCEKRNVTAETQSRNRVNPTCPQSPDKKHEPCYKCEDGWEQHGGKCYYFSVSKSSWEESREECRAKGGHLVKIDSREEQEFLEKTLRNVTKPEDRFWIGLKHSAEDDRWIWTDGSPLDKSLTFWSRNQPNVTKGENPAEQSCVRVGLKDGTSDLKFSPCKKTHRSICEKPAATRYLKCAFLENPVQPL